MKSEHRITLIIALLVLPLAGRVGYCLYQKNRARQVSAHKQPKVRSTDYLSTPTTEQYDYKKMLTLIETSQALKKSYYGQFMTIETEGGDHEISVKETKALLEDLYREKKRFEKFVTSMRLRYKGQVPRKRSNALDYQLRVLDKAISDTEMILRRV